MRSLILLPVAAAAFALAGCQSQPADQVEDQANATANAMHDQADQMPTTAEQNKMDANAEQVERNGEAAAARIDNGTPTAADAHAANGGPTPTAGGSTPAGGTTPTK